MTQDFEKEVAECPEWAEGVNIILFWRFPILEMPEFGTRPEGGVPKYTLANGYGLVPELDYLLEGIITP